MKVCAKQMNGILSRIASARAAGETLILFFFSKEQNKQRQQMKKGGCFVSSASLKMDVSKGRDDHTENQGYTLFTFVYRILCYFNIVE